MYTSVILSALFAAAVMAAPHNVYRPPFKRNRAPSTSTLLPEPDEWVGVYICEHHNWGGKCEYKVSHVGSAPENCVVLDGTASSIGPDESYYCIFYTNAYCRQLASDGSDHFSISYPGEPNLLNTYAGNWNDKAMSYHCFRNDSVLKNPMGD